MPIWFFSIIFSVVYAFFTLVLADTMGRDTMVQMNFGLIIGCLIWIGLKMDRG
jgi:uncharacterized membrane protein YagU involved in acid resistance